jgi:hypothetical protein
MHVAYRAAESEPTTVQSPGVGSMDAIGSDIEGRWRRGREAGDEDEEPH